MFSSNKKVSINFDDESSSNPTPADQDQSNNSNQSGSTPPPTNNDEIDQLKAEIAQLKESVARAQADFINLRRRQAQDAENTIKFAASQSIKELLPVIDNLQRAFQHIPEELKTNQWVNGVIAIEKQFLQTMEKLGVKKITTVGEKADPNFHEIISTTEQANTEADTIVTEIEAGYMLHEKVLRPAKVIVQK